MCVCVQTVLQRQLFQRCLAQLSDQSDDSAASVIARIRFLDGLVTTFQALAGDWTTGYQNRRGV